MPLRLLRLEGAAQLGVAVYFYQRLSFSWILFFVLLLVPDVSAAGYTLGPKIGAYTYNLVHIEVWPLILIAYGHRLPLAIALIWIAHIAGDRALGFGLKYPTDFKDTHLGRLGRSA